MPKQLSCVIDQLNTCFFFKVVTPEEVFLSRKIVAGHRFKMLWITFCFHKNGYTLDFIRMSQ
jgi:hypothetical protein